MDLNEQSRGCHAEEAKHLCALRDASLPQHDRLIPLLRGKNHHTWLSVLPKVASLII